jgi:hypothetical protein
MVSLLHKLAVRMDQIGLGDIRLVPPTISNIDNAPTYLNALFADSVVMSKVDHLGLHNYGGYTGNVDAIVKGSAYPSRNFWLSEWSETQTDGWLTHGAQVADEWAFATTLADNFHKQMATGTAGALVWDGYDNVHDHLGDGLFTHWGLLRYDPVSGVYTPKKRFYATEQLQRFVLPGSYRIAMPLDVAALNAHAYYHPATGGVTIVGHNIASTVHNEVIQLNNMPAPASVALYQTSTADDFRKVSDIAVTNGAFSVSIPAFTIFTITSVASTAPSDTTAPTVSMTSPTAGNVLSGVTSVAGTAGDDVGVTTVQLNVDGRAAMAQSTTGVFLVAWDTRTVANGTHSASVTAFDAAGNQTTTGNVAVSVAN